MQGEDRTRSNRFKRCTLREEPAAGGRELAGRQRQRRKGGSARRLRRASRLVTVGDHQVSIALGVEGGGLHREPNALCPGTHSDAVRLAGSRAAPAGQTTSTAIPRARAYATMWAVASCPLDGEPSQTASSRLQPLTSRSSALTQASRSSGSKASIRICSASASNSRCACRSWEGVPAKASPRSGSRTTRRCPTSCTTRPNTKGSLAPARTNAVAPGGRPCRRSRSSACTRSHVVEVRSACPTAVIIRSLAFSPCGALRSYPSCPRLFRGHGPRASAPRAAGPGPLAPGSARGGGTA